MPPQEAHTADQATSEQAQFAAREFVARFARETGSELSAVVIDRMTFAFEMGYLRGRSDGARVAVQMFVDLARIRAEEGSER